MICHRVKTRSFLEVDIEAIDVYGNGYDNKCEYVIR